MLQDLNDYETVTPSNLLVNDKKSKIMQKNL